MGEIEGVAAAAEVLVTREMAGRQAVIAQVVDAAKRQGRAVLVGFGGMVEDHVENDLEAGGVQGADHCLELGDHRLPVDPRRIARFRREEGERVVAPVIDKTLVRQMPLVEKVAHRQQVDGGDAEPQEMFDHRRGGEAGVGAAQQFGNAGMLPGASLDMRFVENRGR